jgi:ribosome biogenesis GTPase
VEGSEGAPGLVLAVGGGLAAVRLDGGDERLAAFAGRLDQRPVAGDRVRCTVEPDGVRIDRIDPRRTRFARLQITRGDRVMGEQVFAANADLLLIVVAAADPPLRRGLIDRLLVTAWAGDMSAAIVITKDDLAERAEEPIEQVLEDYRALGYAGLAVDGRSAAGIEAVRELIGGRVAVAAGHSGVGKSTLVNGLTGGEQATAAIRELNQRGRHTTTTARWLDLPDGGAVIDMPGVRSFALAAVDAHDLGSAFPEIAALRPGCRFADCRHAGETGCAVAGAISPLRLDSYRKLLEEIERLQASAEPR